jgi:predicted house-cleaning NTP pyrophosphatase (Maf/HAM1 superfamily)
VGSYTGVVGLPVFETVALLAGVGIDPLKRTATQ